MRNCSRTSIRSTLRIASATRALPISLSRSEGARASVLEDPFLQAITAIELDRGIDGRTADDVRPDHRNHQAHADAAAEPAVIPNVLLQRRQRPDLGNGQADRRDQQRGKQRPDHDGQELLADEPTLSPIHLTFDLFHGHNLAADKMVRAF